jgi:hypothetical protein
MTDIAASELANDFYEHKNEERLLSDGKKLNVTVKLTETTETSTTYVIGDLWTAILYRKPGKPVSVTLRPILKA